MRLAPVKFAVPEVCGYFCLLLETASPEVLAGLEPVVKQRLTLNPAAPPSAFQVLVFQARATMPGPNMSFYSNVCFLLSLYHIDISEKGFYLS